MRIALVHPYPWPEVRRGAERYLEELARYLESRGHQVVVVTGTHGRARAESLGASATVRHVRHLRPRWVHRFGVEEVEMFGLASLPILLCARFDCVHAFTPTSALASVFAGQRTIYTVLGHPVPSQLPVQRFPRMLFEEAVRRATVVAALSNASAAAVRMMLGIKPIVLSPGVFLPRFPAKMETRRDAVRILFSGSLSDRRKRLDLAVGVMAAFRSRYPEARLVLSGEGDPGWALEGIGRGAREAVDTMGPGDPEDVPQRYREATVTLLPSENEAFGLTLVESLACGTPVVCTASGGMPEIVDESVGRVADDLSVGALAIAVEEAVVLARAPGTTQRCAARARQWDWDTTVGPAHEDVYRAIVTAGPRRIGARRFFGQQSGQERGSHSDRLAPDSSHISATETAAHREIRVLHFAADWLPASETFVYELVRHVEVPSFVVAAHALQNTERFPWPYLTSLAPIEKFVRPPSARPAMMTAAMVRIARRRRVTVVHVHHGYRLELPLAVAEQLDLPLVISLHGHDLTGWLRTRPGYFDAAACLVNAGRGAVIVPSRFLVEYAEMAGFARSRIRVIPSGVDTSFFTPTEMPRGPGAALFVGRFVEKKGLDTLADAWPFVQQALPESRLVIMGFGPLECVARAIPGNVTVEIGPDRERVRDALRHATALVSPSHRGGDDAVESLLVVNLEAQASGRPVVTTRHGGVPEYVREGRSALVVDEGNSDQLAAALVAVLSDLDLATKMGEEGTKVARSLDVRRTAGSVRALYEELLVANDVIVCTRRAGTPDTIDSDPVSPTTTELAATHE